VKIVSVDEYILNSGPWQESLNMLRELMLGLELEETVKWGTPVYCLDGKNVVGFANFKAYTGLWFYQGALLKDEQKKLFNAQEGKSNAIRQWRFSTADEIEEELDVLIAYVQEAMENTRQGKVFKAEKKKDFSIPEELMEAMQNDRFLKQAYDALSFSKRRDYAGYIGSGKKAETRKRRLDKCIPMIKDGKGFMDQYK
jgi:uncharacterized protein YdeI (YjbR/CyaY-like superfamily)